MLSMLVGKIGLKTVAIGLAVLAVVTVIGLGYAHYKALQGRVVLLEAENAKLELAVRLEKAAARTAAEVAKEWKRHVLAQRESLERLAREARTARLETRRLNDVLAKHDLHALARRKPGLIEARIQRGADAARRVLEDATSDRPGPAEAGKAPDGRAPAATPTDRDKAGEVARGNPRPAP